MGGEGGKRETGGLHSRQQNNINRILAFSRTGPVFSQIRNCHSVDFEDIKS